MLWIMFCPVCFFYMRKIITAYPNSPLTTPHPAPHFRQNESTQAQE